MLERRYEARIARFFLVVRTERVHIVKTLISSGRIDPSIDNNKALHQAAAKGRLEIVKLLFTNQRVAGRLLPLEWAAAKSYVELVKLLLADPRIDPASNNDRPIRLAAKNGNTEIVKLLLMDKRVNPQRNMHRDLSLVGTESRRNNKEAMEGSALNIAVNYEQLEILKIFLADSRVDFVKDYRAIITQIINDRKIEILKFFLTNPHVNSAKINNRILNIAVNYRYPEAVKILLADPHVNPAADDNLALILAVYSGYLDAVRILLADPRINPAKCQESVLRESIVDSIREHQNSNRPLAVFKLLLADLRTNIDPKIMLSNACGWPTQVKIAEALFTSKRMVTKIQNSIIRSENKSAGYKGNAFIHDQFERMQDPGKKLTMALTFFPEVNQKQREAALKAVQKERHQKDHNFFVKD